MNAPTTPPTPLSALSLYEAEKAKLQAMGLPPAEYEAAIKRLAQRLQL